MTQTSRVMIEQVLSKLPTGLVNYLCGPSAPDEAWLRDKWRSLTCQTCGVCCHSSLVPITERDFDSFYKGLDLNISKEEFATKFLQNPNTNAPFFTIETARYGGCCLFLEKRDAFYCGVWNQRAKVCNEYFCWPMTKFEHFESGKEQGLFDNNKEWIDNFSHLLDIIIPETIGELFDDDRGNYFQNYKQQESESYFSTHPDEF